MSYVEGNVKANSFHVDDIRGRLKTLGYETEGNNLKKQGKIESIINELVPLIEEQGANAFSQLYLKEYDGVGKMTAEYKDGKVNRYDS